MKRRDAALLPLCLALAACAAEEPERMVMRSVHTDLLEGDEHYEVVRKAAGAEVRRMILTPALHAFVDGGDLPSLVMPPSAEVKIQVPQEGGPFLLHGAAGIDVKSGKSLNDASPVVTILFELEVDGERRFESTQTVRPREGIRGPVENPMSWARFADGEGLQLNGGETITLRTDLLASASLKPAELLCGFGGLRLEVVTERERLKASPETPNIVFVVMDTLRADRTHLEGYERDTTPHLARISERAIIYDQALSTSSWTWPSTASFLTGLPPEAHGVLLHRSSWLAHSLTTLPEALQARGYTTGGFSANPLISPNKNFSQGFERFEAPETEFVSGEVVMPDCLAWVREHAEHRFFLYLHLADPHVPHEPHPEELERLGLTRPEDFPEQGFELAHGVLRQQLLQPPFGETDITQVLPPEHVQWIDDEYDACVATGDRHLGALLDLLEAEGLMEKTIIAFVSDHGEELLDHGALDHARTLHPELVRVPMLIAGPGIEPARISEPTSTRHLGPTLARFGGAELELPQQALNLADPREAAASAVHFRTDKGFWGHDAKATILGVRVGELSLHWAPNADEAPAHRLYDISTDPTEQNDLAASRPEDVARLSELIDAHQREWARSKPETLEGGARAAAMLRAIGYAGEDE
ncbi:MAG: sulfatase [Planctomycetes bacterium]|nr:sulfatase [Planctomycetota bacterium]